MAIEGRAWNENAFRRECELPGAPPHGATWDSAGLALGIIP